MKRLLLLLSILFPAVLPGQERQKAMVDSIQSAATDLQRISDFISGMPGAKVEYVHAAGGDGYVTVSIRVKVAEPIAINALSPLPITSMNIGDIVAERVTVVAVPPAPYLKEVDTILALSYLNTTTIKMEDIVAGRVTTIPVPPQPYFILADTIPSLELLTVFNLKIEKVRARKMDLASVPPLPIIKDDVNALVISAIAQFAVRDIPVSNIDNIPVPPLPYIIADIQAVPVSSIIPCSIKQTVPTNMHTVAVPGIPDIQTDDFLALHPAVMLAIPPTTAGKMELGALPDPGINEVTVAGMHLSADGYALLEKMEGFSPELYALGDGGCTIGFGFFVPYAEIGKWRKGITWEEAERLIRQKVPTYEDQVKQYINVPLIQEEFDALTMLAYNLGGFSRATSIVNDIDNNADFEKLQRDWMRFVHSKAPNVLKGLLNRRHDEMAVRRESNYQPERKILVYKNKR